MKEIIDDILRPVGVAMLLCAVIRYVSFYFLYFRSRISENRASSHFYIGADRFSSKVFSKIDFQVPVRLNG